MLFSTVASPIYIATSSVGGGRWGGCVEVQFASIWQCSPGCQLGAQLGAVDQHHEFLFSMGSCWMRGLLPSSMTGFQEGASQKNQEEIVLPFTTFSQK